ncbi:DUF5050 domain-containing protein [Clostridium sp. FP1]|uniref:DUF5050 domain-containing protein n=1 Tax=Clostridium sp. FP1 TaxID=2724076 RepID=UPI0013E98B8F|nr:DUF5050 domain-containing protein [Clostridium sp. FP1]MBZ9635658.1 DUF5050 domain-containing protein [Clostridium sp. FP1]
MKNINPFLKLGVCVLCSSMLILTGNMAVQASDFPTVVHNSAEVNTVKSNEAFVYYVSNSVLYRAMSDGTKSQKLLNNFLGVKLIPAGDYLYYMYDNSSTTLLRIPMDGSANIASRFASDVVYFVADGEFIYYMNEKGAIYRASANASKGFEPTLITDMADTRYPKFNIIDGKIYYNARKSGRTTWVASKAIDGSGQVQWIAAGSVIDPWFIHEDSASINMIINTKPEETKYSLKCMVLYSLPKKGGAAKAISAKAPLDTNAVYSGAWASGYYMYNKDIKLGSDGDFDYTKSKGFAFDMIGNNLALHTTGIVEIANLGSDKLVFVDGYGKAFVSTLKGNKITSKKQLSIKNAGYVRNLITDGKVRSTMLFAESGAYMLQPDSSLKQMVGVEWDLCMYKDDVSGFFYVNAGDNGRLYRMNDDGKTNVKLCDEKVDRIVLISKL